LNKQGLGGNGQSALEQINKLKSNYWIRF
jgi:hypothetical protein